MMEMRPATRDDASAMLGLLQSVCREGSALPFTDGIDAGMIDHIWLQAKGCVLACDNGEVLGMYRYGPAMPGRGSHIATATFLVSENARGRGVGRVLVGHCLQSARAAGFRAMQFNQVLSSNQPALALYRSMGFVVIGTVPKAFDHIVHGYVDAHIMYREL
ncbi:GNAT family N-acetyltransferase [Massilia phosphatilytica]|jgi:ribosomal protein S18 acetylase RimI-like enzyme|nr:GNAT family N-acetyltransferase [Massilia phosphatilytica]